MWDDIRRRSDRKIRRLGLTIYKSIIKKLIPIIKGGIYIRRKIFIYSTNIKLTEFIKKKFTKYAEVNKEGRK